MLAAFTPGNDEKMNSVFEFSADSVSALARVDAVRALDEDMGGRAT